MKMQIKNMMNKKKHTFYPNFNTGNIWKYTKAIKKNTED